MKHASGDAEMPVAESSKVRVDAGQRLIFPLDVSTVDAAKQWIRDLDGIVSFFKIGLELYVASGVSLIPYLIENKKKVFLDLKYYDVPETVKRAVKQVANLGVSFLTVHGNGKIIQAAVEGRGASDLKLLSVTVLTCLDDEDMKEFGFACTVPDLVLHRARKALEAGCDGVISSPQEAEKVRDLAAMIKGSNNKFLVVTPGVRPGNSSTDDHKRLARPLDAIRAGADYLVIGRPIREAANPQQAARDIVTEMQAAFDSLP
jgi:orotidine-5'-phosphate decarboxylase